MFPTWPNHLANQLIPWDFLMQTPQANQLFYYGRPVFRISMARNVLNNDLMETFMCQFHMSEINAHIHYIMCSTAVALHSCTKPEQCRIVSNWQGNHHIYKCWKCFVHSSRYVKSLSILLSVEHAVQIRKKHFVSNSKGKGILNLLSI